MANIFGKVLKVIAFGVEILLGCQRSASVCAIYVERYQLYLRFALWELLLSFQ